MIFLYFYQVNNLFLHQSYLKSPLPVKLTWWKMQKIICYYWKNSKKPQVPSSEFHIYVLNNHIRTSARHRASFGAKFWARDKSRPARCCAPLSMFASFPVQPVERQDAATDADADLNIFMDLWGIFLAEIWKSCLFGQLSFTVAIKPSVVRLEEQGCFLGRHIRHSIALVRD